MHDPMHLLLLLAPLEYLVKREHHLVSLGLINKCCIEEATRHPKVETEI